MTDTTDAAAGSRAVARQSHSSPRIEAARVPTPSACGCGLPIAFDLDKHEFFCIGCGASKLCLCRRSPFSSGTRPVHVV